MRIHLFKQYCKNFNIDDIFRQIADKRKRPQIKTRQICWAIVNMVSIGIKSLLELDQLGRLPQMRKLIGTKRYIVCSDTTYDRALKLMSADSIRMASKKIYGKMSQNDLDAIRLNDKRWFRVAGIDASGFGKHKECILTARRY